MAVSFCIDEKYFKVDCCDSCIYLLLCWKTLKFTLKMGKLCGENIEKVYLIGVLEENSKKLLPSPYKTWKTLERFLGKKKFIIKVP